MTDLEQPNELSAELKAKYPTAKHAPMPGCERCKGAGEQWYESKSPYSRSGWLPCVCLFVEHRHVALVSDVIRTVVEKETRHV